MRIGRPAVDSSHAAISNGSFVDIMPTSIILMRIMLFLDRREEMARLDSLARRRDGGLAVVYGRRRVGKTRLLLEWTRKHDGLYTVSDQSSPDIQRRYLAEAVSARFPGFADVDYPDWRSLLTRLVHEARAARWRGPLVLDELPYLVLSSPELPSILQLWMDHEAKEARLVVALAGSSQRMMQGLALSREAPLYGRAREILEIAPLDPDYLGDVFGRSDRTALVEQYASWGGVPRYWELAAEAPGSPKARVERLVLDPLGPLHREPDRLLIEETPPALEVRPLLDAIGAGVHRMSEIAARIGRPATSMARPLDRLVGMGLVRRDVPFGTSERETRRSLYRMNDPLFRLWFRVVAPHRGALAMGSRRSRRSLLDRYWSPLVSEAWEELCRRKVPHVRAGSRLGRFGPWGPASRWWQGAMAEWDLVAESADGKRLVFGEVKWSARPMEASAIEHAVRRLTSKPPPALPPKYVDCEIVRALFVPELAAGESWKGPLPVVTCSDLID